MKNILRLVLFICCSVLLFSSCQKEYSNETGATQISTGTLKDSTGNCLPDSVAGTFYDGITPGSDTAYVEIQVDVTKTGAYTISTDFQNGFEFADSGFFTSTGINVIRLKPIGTPILPNASVFTVSYDSSFCSFTVNVQDSTGTGIHSGGQDTVGSGDPDNMQNNSWQFTANGRVYAGSISNAQFGAATSGTQLYIIGNMQSNSPDTTFGITVQFPANTLDKGTYPTSDAGTNFSLEKTATGDIIFAANATSADTQVINIIITNYDSSTKIVTGTFSGDSYDFNGNDAPVTSGAFKATIQ